MNNKLKFGGFLVCVSLGISGVANALSSDGYCGRLKARCFAGDTRVCTVYATSCTGGIETTSAKDGSLLKQLEQIELSNQLFTNLELSPKVCASLKLKCAAGSQQICAVVEQYCP